MVGFPTKFKNSPNFLKITIKIYIFSNSGRSSVGKEHFLTVNLDLVREIDEPIIRIQNVNCVGDENCLFWIKVQTDMQCADATVVKAFEESMTARV